MGARVLFLGGRLQAAAVREGNEEAVQLARAPRDVVVGRRRLAVAVFDVHVRHEDADADAVERSRHIVRHARPPAPAAVQVRRYQQLCARVIVHILQGGRVG